MNTNVTNSLSQTMAAFYDKKLIMNAKPNLVHYAHGQTSILPKNAGKSINFRKWTPFQALTKPLAEGVAPDGQTLSMNHVTADIEQYGGYVAVSDLLDMTALDPVVNDSVELMGDQGGLTIDTIIRDTICKAQNVQYPNGKLSKSELIASDKLTVQDIRLAVRCLKRNKAPMFSRGGKGFYVAIVSPDTVYDLQSDPAWQDASKYAGSEQIFDGEMGRLYGVVFIETTEAKVFSAPDLTSEVRTLTVRTIVNKVITIEGTLSSEDAASLVGRTLLINGEECLVEAANATTITLSQEPAGTVSANDIIYPGEGGSEGMSVAATLVFGKNAYGVVELQGGNLRSIVKPKGSAGTSDPLDQISTIGWKVEGFAAKVLQPLWIVRIEHACTN